MSQLSSGASSRAPNTPSALSVITRMPDEGVAAGNGAVVDELCSTELVEHQFGLTGTRASAIKKVKDAVRQLHASDLTFAIEDSVDAGGTVWVRSRARTASGRLFGPPSGRPVDITVIDVARVTCGRIVEHRRVPDRSTLLAQTGALSRLRRSSEREEER